MDGHNMQRSFVVTLIIFLNIYSNPLADDNIQLPEKTVIILSEYWCPLVCLDSDLNQGLLIDITKAAFNVTLNRVSLAIKSFASRS